VTAAGWKRRFDEPILIDGGDRISTLQQAIAYLANEIPEDDHAMTEVQASAHCVTDAAENNGPMLFARIGMMQAIHRQRDFDPSRKEAHWGNGS
jgi:hypothetical protein